MCLQFSDQRGREVIHPNVKPHDFSDSCDYHSYTLPKKKNTGFFIKRIMCFVLLHKCIYCWKIFNRDMLSITGLMRKTSLLTVELFRRVPLSDLLLSDVSVSKSFCCPCQSWHRGSMLIEILDLQCVWWPLSKTTLSVSIWIPVQRLTVMGEIRNANLFTTFIRGDSWITTLHYAKEPR